MLYTILSVLVFFVGASIGSFLNLVAYRVPLGMSVIWPRSFCPHCHHNISALGLIPVLGYFFMRGRCQYCDANISFQYPFIELMSGAITVFIFLKYNFLLNNNVFMPFIVSLWLLYTGIVLSLIDIKYRILPDVIVLPGICIGFLISVFNPAVGWFNSLLGILVGVSVLYFISYLYKILRKQDGMGMGDVKYLGFLGAVLGWKDVIFALLVASFIGSVYGIILGIFNKKGLSTSLPFGPFLALGFFIVNISW